MQTLTLIHSKSFPIARYAEAFQRESIAARLIDSLDHIPSDAHALRVVLVDAAMHILAAAAAFVLAAQAAAPQKIEIVSITGCLKETTPNNWTLVSATDPVPSSANAPPARDIPSTPPAGKNEFKLIGVSEFNLPAHRDHTVILKGLFIKATPMSRLNITSVTMVAPTCTAQK